MDENGEQGQQGRRHVSKAAMATLRAMHGDYYGDCDEWLMRQARCVVLTVAEVEAMECRHEERGRAVMELMAESDTHFNERNALRAELEALRAQLAEREAECERLRRSADGWQQEALHYALKADHWREKYERLRGSEDGKSVQMAADSSDSRPSDASSRGSVGVRNLTADVRLDHRLGLGPQPETETVEPMSARSWKRRGFP